MFKLRRFFQGNRRLLRFHAAIRSRIVPLICRGGAAARTEATGMAARAISRRDRHGRPRAGGLCAADAGLCDRANRLPAGVPFCDGAQSRAQLSAAPAHRATGRSGKILDLPAKRRRTRRPNHRGPRFWLEPRVLIIVLWICPLSKESCPHPGESRRRPRFRPLFRPRSRRRRCGRSAFVPV